jgi:hypothetical protein
VQRETRDVRAEIVGKLNKKMDAKALSASVGEEHGRDAACPNLDRLTVGMDLGDQWSHYCILGLQGEALAEGQLRTRQQEMAEFLGGLAESRMVIEVGTHSAWGAGSHRRRSAHSQDRLTLLSEGELKTRTAFRARRRRQMRDPKEIEELQSEIARDKKRYSEIERIEGEILENISHEGFAAASQEGRLRDEREALAETIRRNEEMLARATSQINDDMIVNDETSQSRKDLHRE